MTNRLVRLLTYSSCTLLLAGMASAADPESLGLIPSDTVVVVGINIEQIRSSKLGQMAFSQIETQAKGADAAMANAGLDLLKGIREVLIAAPATAQKGRVLILVTGTFNPAALQALAKLVGMTEATVQGVTVFTKEQQEPFSAAVVDSSLILGGDPASLKAALARRGGQPGGLDAAVAAKLLAVRASHHLWLLTTASMADLARNAPPEAFGGALQNDALKSILQVSGGLTFGPKLLIAFEVVTRTEQDATSMADGLRALIGMATMGDNAKQFAPLLQTLDLKAEGTSMKLGLAIAEEDILKLIPPGMQGQQPAPAPKPQQQ
ncbi:MAG: hypothetical protein ABSH05_21380 [Bryobacteraceae bacterium]|jgi:hypothetical protein